MEEKKNIRKQEKKTLETSRQTLELTINMKPDIMEIFCLFKGFQPKC